MEPGIYTDISHDEYHGMKDIVSNSYLGRLDIVPALAKVKQEESKTFDFGRAFHCLLLEGQDAFNKQFFIGEAGRGHKTKEDKAYWEGVTKGNPDKTILAREVAAPILEMCNAAIAHPLAKKLLKDITPETSLFWQDSDTGIPCKARPDGIPKGKSNVILDLKSTADASEYAFQRDCVRYGYAREAAIYTEGYSITAGITIEELIFAFIAVEKKPPYRTEVYVLEDSFIAWGRSEFHRLLNIEKECRANNHWPNYKCKGAATLTRPSYVTDWEKEEE